MKATDVMTRRVVTVHPDTPVGDAIRLMLQNDMSGLPVVARDGALVGMVTEGDFLRRAELGTGRKHRRWLEVLIGPQQLAEEYVQAHARTVGEVMTRNVVTAGPDAPLDEVVAAMERHRVKRIPILQGETLVGLVSRADLLRAFGAVSSVEPKADEELTDAAIRDQILADLDRQAWAPATRISVVVWAGTVHLWGTVEDEAQRRALIVLAENVTGVAEVRDHLVVIEPVSTFVS